MSRTYIIQWKSKINGRAGRGSKFFTLEEARMLVNELNGEYPNIHHEIMESNNVSPAPHESAVENTPETAEPVSESEADKTSIETHAFSE